MACLLLPLRCLQPWLGCADHRARPRDQLAAAANRWPLALTTVQLPAPAPAAMARTRTEKGEGGPPARKAPRKSARAAAAGSDAAFCQRCDEACDKETSLRAVASGRGRQLSIIGCDTCWATYERHYIGEYAWADVCEKSHEEDEFRDDFGKHADADRELEEQ
eukprot:8854472-Pyramimonas_sp.AAC.1